MISFSTDQLHSTTSIRLVPMNCIVHNKMVYCDVAYVRGVVAGCFDVLWFMCFAFAVVGCFVCGVVIKRDDGDASDVFIGFLSVVASMCFMMAVNYYAFHAIDEIFATKRRELLVNSHHAGTDDVDKPNVVVLPDGSACDDWAGC